MSKVLKRAYQFLLLSYPTVTRTERGSVELDTLMEVSRPNRVLPRFGEARAIVVEGIRERVRRNGGTTVNEVMASGGTLGVLFSFSLQLWWVGMMLAKSSTMKADRNQAGTVFSAWGLIICALMIWWSLRPSRFTLLVWQLANVVGAIWMVRFVRDHAAGSNGLDTVLIGMFLIVSTLVFSSGIVLNCWSRMPKTARHRLGGKHAAVAILVPMWASTYGLKYLNGAFSGWVVIGLLLLSLIDPRILIGLSIALLTPAVAMVMVISTYGSGSLSTKLTFPGMCLGVMVLLWMRVRVLVRRTLASINQV
jgi:hypothetical protein